MVVRSREELARGACTTAPPRPRKPPTETSARADPLLGIAPHRRRSSPGSARRRVPGRGAPGGSPGHAARPARSPRTPCHDATRTAARTARSTRSIAPFSPPVAAPVTFPERHARRHDASRDSWWMWAALAVAVEDHDELGRAVAGRERVRGHGGELGGLAGRDDDLPLAEEQPDPALDHEEPVVTGMDPLLRSAVGRFEPHLDRDRAAGRSTQHPGRGSPDAARHRVDDHVVVAARSSSVSRSTWRAPARGSRTSRLIARLPVSMRLMVDALRLVRSASPSSDSPSVFRRLRSRARTTCSISSDSCTGAPPPDSCKYARSLAGPGCSVPSGR